MTDRFIPQLTRKTKLVATLAAVVALSACSNPPTNFPADQPFDPYEAQNRQVHNFNRSLDKGVIRPVSRGYSNFMPDDIETVIGRFANNLSLPRAVVNNVLQGNMRGAFQDTGRFLVNSTVGLAGTFDPATEMGMAAATDADFGQTLHVWGAREGAYVELPLLGPSTERDTWGRVVDIFTDPLRYVLDDPESYYRTGASISSGLSNRARFSDTIDSVLYESADSYAQARSLYLQNRRFELGKGGGDAYLDPYDDPYGPSSSNGLNDPYEEASDE